MYGEAVSFTDNIKLAQQFGEEIIGANLEHDINLFYIFKEPKDKDKKAIGSFLKENGYDGLVFDDEKWGTRCLEYMIFNLDKLSIK